jgi:hypothetical protein
MCERSISCNLPQTEQDLIMDAIVITNYPLPPSENQIYRNVPGVGRVATKELKDYRKSCEYYHLNNPQVFETIKEFIVDRWKKADHFKVDYYFTFKRERLYTKDNRPKKLDVANRIKAVQDCFFHSLGMDDKHVFATSIEKIIGEQECVTIVMHPHTPISAIELLELFQQSQESPAVLLS